MEQEVSTVTRSFVVEDAGSLMPLFGLNDENIELIKKELGISLFTRGGEITLTGEEDSVSAAITTLEKLTQIIKRGDSIDKTRILYAIDLAREGNAERIEEIMQGVIAITFKGRQVKCKTLGQKKYVDAIKHNTCTFGIGPAGTGKTYLAVAMAVVALKNKDAERIILTRPAVEAGEKLGFLPGDMQQKVDPYLRPLYDALFDMLGADTYQKYLERGNIEVAPLAYMRGRTLDSAFIILDEAQNTTPAQMKMFLTRIGFGSKVIITGDLSQRDLPKDVPSGLDVAVKVLKDIDGISFIRLSSDDVVRHPLVQKIVRAYEVYESEAARKAAARKKEIKP